MARRATALKEFRESAAGRPLFLLSGGHTFTPLDASTPDARLTAALAKAYSRLGYDLGLITPAEAGLLRAANAPIPANWIMLDDTVKVRLLSKGKVTLGIVIFPALADDAQAGPSEAVRKAISAAANDLRGRADLVVGMSTWGVQAEQRLLDGSPLAMDLLLGTGRGLGFNGRLMNGDKLLWMRIFDKGKALQRIDALALPGKSGTAWRQGQNIAWSTIPLTEKLYPDPGMGELFAPFEKK